MKPINLTQLGALNATPVASFDNPSALLHACHDRVEERCDLLEKLLHHTQSQGADQKAIDAAANILRYFDIAAPLHHEDEEKHIFPRLLASGNAALVQCAHTLQQQHVDMSAAWQRLRPLLIDVQQGDASAFLKQKDLVTQFVALYRAHIELEESQAFPHGFEHMQTDEQAEMGKEMAMRRGASLPKGV